MIYGVRLFTPIAGEGRNMEGGHNMRLDVHEVNKSFSGKQILHDVSFSVESGRAMGFLGRNGAGKTTTIRTMMNVFKPDSGNFTVDGKPLNSKDFRIGYLPEERGMYAKVNVRDQLAYFGKLKGMKSKEAYSSADRWLEYAELSEYGNKRLETLSKGNQQKVQIIQAVINEPDILILDEPFSGLDPVNAQTLKNIVLDFIRRNKIVIFSSHQMSYVEEFCDDVTFIKKGRIIRSGSLSELKRSYGKNKRRIRINGMENREVIKHLSTISSIEATEDRRSPIFTCDKASGANEVLRYFMERGHEIDLFSVYETSLEDIFILLDGVEKDTPDAKEVR